MTGQSNAGGIVGDSATSAVVRNCYSTGRVASDGTYGTAGGITGIRLNQSPGDAQRFKDRIEHCYSTAEVLGRYKAGGIIGDAMKYITVSHNAALNSAVGITGIEDNSQSGNIGRITSEPLYQTYFTGEGNYALSGMPVNKETVQGDDGSGKNGKDGELAAITQDPVLFPDTDWVRAEGCYPVLKVFAGQQPIPFGEMLEEQGEGRTVGIVLDAPDTWTFPEVSEGYGPQPEKAVTVRSTGTMETEALTVELTEQSADFTGVGTAAAAPYFILSDTRLESIAPGASAEFTVKPAGGLAAGTYRAKVVARGSYGQKDTMAVSFTVKEVPVVYYSVTVENDGNGTAGADRDRAAEGTPVKLTAKPNAGYRFKEWQNADTLTFIEGDINSPSAGITMPGRNVTVKAVFEADTRPEQPSGGSGGSSDSGVNPYILHGSWQRLENGIWQFRLMSGEYAKSRWGLIGGRWYYFDAEGNMVTGWQYIGGAWYFLATEEDTKRMEGIKEGIMITGWYFDPFYQKWFYLDTNGAMVIGWKEIDGKWYYFNPVSDGAKGAMAVNTWIDGRYVDEYGVRV